MRSFVTPVSIFGQRNFFKKIFNRLEDKTKIVEIEIMKKLTETLNESLIFTK